jgi:hypothetical protein
MDLLLAVVGILLVGIGVEVHVALRVRFSPRRVRGLTAFAVLRAGQPRAIFTAAAASPRSRTSP